MLKYLVLSPNETILGQVKEQLETQGLPYFDAYAAKHATNAEDSKRLGLTRSTPTQDEPASVLTTQCRIVAGYHDPDEVMRRLQDNDVLIMEPESVRIVAEMFPDVTFDVIIAYGRKSDITDEYRFEGLVHIDDESRHFPENVTSTLMAPVIEDEQPAAMLVDYLRKRRIQHANVRDIALRFVDLGLLTQQADGRIVLNTLDKDGKPNPPMTPTLDGFVTLQIDDEDKLNHMLSIWMGMDRLGRKDAPPKPKIVILGRTGTGKTKLMKEIILCADKISNDKIVPLKTTTTRPQRPYNDDHYHFITKELAARIPNSEKYLRTFIGEHEYFARKKDIDDANIMVLDPNGLEDLMGMYPDTPFLVCYVRTNEKLSDEHLVTRHKDLATAKKQYEDRYAAEDETFTQFEKDIERFMDVYTNATSGTIVTEYVNNFDPARIKEFACRLMQTYKCFSNLQCLYAPMGTAAGLPRPSIDEINSGAAQLVLDPEGISEFMISLTMTVAGLPIDWSFKPEK